MQNKNHTFHLYSEALSTYIISHGDLENAEWGSDLESGVFQQGFRLKPGGDLERSSGLVLFIHSSSSAY